MTYTIIANDIARHEKCIKILEMINKAKRYYSSAIEQYQLWENAKWNSPIRFMNPSGDRLAERVRDYKEIITRLESYYYSNTIISHSHAA